METITMNDGQIIKPVQTFGAVEGLWIHIPGMSLAVAYQIFSNPAKTIRTVVDSIPEAREAHQEYTGYTELVMVRIDDSGEAIVQLTKAVK